MYPDTGLGENARHGEVFDEQEKTYVFPGVQTAGGMLGAGSRIQPRGGKPVVRYRRIGAAPLGATVAVGAARHHSAEQGNDARSAVAEEKLNVVSGMGWSLHLHGGRSFRQSGYPPILAPQWRLKEGVQSIRIPPPWCVGPRLPPAHR